MFDFVFGRMKKKYIMTLIYKEKEGNNCESIPHDYTVKWKVLILNIFYLRIILLAAANTTNIQLKEGSFRLYV